MGDGLQAGGFGEVVDLDRLGKPAAPAEIGLENIDGAVFDQVQKSLATVVVFAACMVRALRADFFEDHKSAPPPTIMTTPTIHIFQPPLEVQGLYSSRK